MFDWICIWCVPHCVAGGQKKKKEGRKEACSDDMWVWLCLSSLLLGLVALLWLRDAAKQQHLPPGPVGLPFLGYLPWIDSVAPYETFARLSHRYGRIYSLRLGNMLAIFVTDPQLVRQAFSRPVFSGRAPLYLTHGIMKGHGTIAFFFLFHFLFCIIKKRENISILAPGLICAEGDSWREHRRFVINVMKQLGMAGRQGASLMESRVMDRVLEFVDVMKETKQNNKNSFFFF